MTYTTGKKRKHLADSTFIGMITVNSKGVEMFIHNLNVSQQQALLSLSRQLILVDGKVDDRELALIDAVKSRCVENLDESKRITFSQIGELFDTHKQKVSFMLELIGIAFADHQYADEEKHFVKNAAQALEVSNGLLEDLENWVQRQFILVKEANLFMEV